MWAGNARRAGPLLKEGALVICSGKPTVYAGQGRLQFVIEHIQAVGEGLLRAQFEELRKKLTAEGIFDASRKRALPYLPVGIGIVTSASGAVIHDMRVKLDERFPGMRILLEDVPVQGEGAAEKIARAIGLLNGRDDINVIIVARGGGSLEDLWCFNDERVVRAVFASIKPVISGVGHETDVTLCDLAADVRAPTPTAAAELVVPRVEDLRAYLLKSAGALSRVSLRLQDHFQNLDQTFQRFERAMVGTFERRRQLVDHLKQRTRALEPGRFIELQRGTTSKLRDRLAHGVSQNIQIRRVHLHRLGLQSALARSSRAIAEQLHDLSRRQLQLSGNLMRHVASHGMTLQSLAARLEASSPNSILARGYTLVFRGDQLVTTHADMQPAGSRLSVQFASGSTDVVVEKGTSVTLERRLGIESKSE
jgi:exodeoxyribonuclease VII large subunit